MVMDMRREYGGISTPVTRNWLHDFVDAMIIPPIKKETPNDDRNDTSNDNNS
jgi:hypothetical protein